MKQKSRPSSAGGGYAILPGADGDAARLSGTGTGALCEGGDEEGRDDGMMSHDDELLPSKELRLNVFREVLCAGRSPRPPRYYEARPKHFPPELDVVLTGGLYTSIHKAVVEFVPFYNQVYILLFASMLIGYIVAFWDTPILFQATEDGGRKFNFAGYAFYAVCVYYVSTAVACFITRPAVKRFHDRMETVVQEMSPLFRRVGYDLEYHQREPTPASASWWARLYSVCDRESFVRIVPFKGELTPEDAARADALWDPQRRPGGDPTAATTGPEQTMREFRVAVYGAKAYPGQVGFGREPSFVMTRSYQRFSDCIDEYSWGAVSTEMRPYTERYRQARSWSSVAALALCPLPAWMPDAFSSWYVVTPYIVLMACLYVFLFYPTALETWWLTRVGGIPEPDDIQAAIQRLSPIVEDRSGYGLRLDTQQEGCFGGTGAYVCFVPCGNAAPGPSV